MMCYGRDAMAFPVRLTSVMRNRYRSICLALLALFLCVRLSFGDKKPPSVPAGTLATAIRETLLFVSADDTSQRLANITPGREMVIVERNGEWLRVFANTDVEESHAQDAPIFGAESAPPPISGWTKTKGVIAADTPNGDEVLFGIAANTEELASEPHPPKRAAQDARLLSPTAGRDVSQSKYAGGVGLAGSRYSLAVGKGRRLFATLGA